MKLWLLVRDDESGEMVLNSIWEDQPNSYAAIARVISDMAGSNRVEHRIIRGVAITIEDVK